MNFFSFVDTHLHREKIGSGEAFPLKKTTRRFPAAVNFSLRLCAKKSFLSATTALGLQGDFDLGPQRFNCLPPLDKWMVGRRAIPLWGPRSLLRSEQKKLGGVYPDVKRFGKDSEKMEEMLEYEANRPIL